jgi:hypothetical protein
MCASLNQHGTLKGGDSGVDAVNRYGRARRGHYLDVSELA